MYRKLLVLLLSSSFLTGCSMIQVVEADHSQHGGLLSKLGDFSMSDLMFAQMMIPHHEQAIQMAEWVKTRAEDPKVKALAEKILSEQAPEIATMSSWLKEAGQALEGHSMHTTGMLSEEELEKLKALSGKAFDKYFLESMIKHHEGAVVMAQDALNTSNVIVKTLLENIIQTQNLEISEMQKLLELSN
jgi:uncharacterized protein (DUF305 family)